MDDTNTMKEGSDLALCAADSVSLPYGLPNTSHPGPMRWIVQKFGGTSLGHFASNIVEEIILPETLNSRVAVVCSAISQSTKENGTTNRLLLACHDLRTNGTRFPNITDQVQLEHIREAEREIRSSKIRESLIGTIRHKCACVLKSLNAAYFLGEISPVCVGKIVAAGERLSCHYITAILQDRGHEATCVDISDYKESTVLPNDWTDKDFMDSVAAELSLKACSARGIPVITGYFGLQPAGALLDFCGRGYTDLCAALIATGLKAAQLQIWKEVDGVCTADPRHVPDAKMLHLLSLSELRNLTFYGSEVVHCSAVDVAIGRDLMMSIRNVRNPSGPGTLVTTKVGAPSEEIVAITKKDHMAILSLCNLPGLSLFKLQAYVSDILQKWQLTGEIVTISGSRLSLAVPVAEDQANGALPSAGLRLQYAIEELRLQFTSVNVSHHMTLLCVVCRFASSIDHALVCILRVLQSMAIPVKMIMHGEIDKIVGCVVEEEYAELATKAIHRDLFSNPSMVISGPEESVIFEGDK